MEDANGTPKNYEWRGRLRHGVRCLIAIAKSAALPPARIKRNIGVVRGGLHTTVASREKVASAVVRHTTPALHMRTAHARGFAVKLRNLRSPPTDAPAQRAQNFWPRIHVAPSDYMALTRGGELCNAEGHLGPDEFEAAMREQIRQYIQGQLANTEQRR